MKNYQGTLALSLPQFLALILLLGVVTPTQAEVLCKNKKTSAVVSRKACSRAESALTAVEVKSTSTVKTAGIATAAAVSLSDTGVVTSGADISTGLDVSVNRLGATGGTLNNTGLNVAVVGDSGGDSTNVGLSVIASGADTNYSAIFRGGNVGIGVSDPDEQLELTGRVHLGQSSAPSSTINKLYNVGGTLFWGGQSVAVGAPDTGTSANDIVQLNSNAELPAISGANLTNLNATNLSSGTISDTRLSGNVSLLGASVALGSEVTGTLPIASGGTGTSSLNNLITLGTHTTGNYVTSVTSSSGISGGAAGSEGATLALSVDQAFSPIWTGTHSFQSSANFGTTTASVEVLHLNGRVQMEPGSAPSATTNKLYNVGGELFFNGQNLSTSAAGGDITGVVAGTGLTGGASTGDATLTVDVGTAASKIVQLNGSAQLPAVSGVNLTNLNATNLASGSVADARLSANVSLLGPVISLTSEVAGTLPVANGGTGAASLTDLVALGTNTTGNYVASVAASTGITVNSSGVEGGTATLSVNQAFTPVWTGTHTFSGVATDITTGTNEDFAVVPNGMGRVGIGTNTPSAMLDTVFTSTAATGTAQTGVELNFTDTGNVSSGSDAGTGLDLNVVRTGASGGTITTTGMDLSVIGDTGGTSTATGLNVAVSGADTNYAALFSGGNVGIGTSTPIALFQTALNSAAVAAGNETGASIDVTDTGGVSSGTDTTAGLAVNVSRTSASDGNINSSGITVVVTGDAAGTSTTRGLSVTVSGADTNVAATFSGGSVGIGDTTAVSSSNVPSGSLIIGSGALCIDDGGTNCDDVARVAGTIYATNTTVANVDVAEQFPIELNDTVEAGDIVSIDTRVGSICLELAQSASGAPTCARTAPGNVPFVTRSSGDLGQEQRKRVIGVVSTAPGVLLGGFAQPSFMLYLKVPVALVGRVPVKVSIENGSIEIGDRIVASSTRGVGMRAASDNETGTVGIALESFDGSQPNERILALIR